MTEQELMNREYDIRQVPEDPRLKRCTTEFFVLLAIIAVTISIIIILCYVVDWGPVSGYTYLLGVPMWMALSAIVALVGTAACLFYCLRGVEDTPLDSDMTENKEVQV